MYFVFIFLKLNILLLVSYLPKYVIHHVFNETHKISRKFSIYIAYIFKSFDIFAKFTYIFKFSIDIKNNREL